MSSQCDNNAGGQQRPDSGFGASVACCRPSGVVPAPLVKPQWSDWFPVCPVCTIWLHYFHNPFPWTSPQFYSPYDFNMSTTRLSQFISYGHVPLPSNFSPLIKLFCWLQQFCSKHLQLEREHPHCQKSQTFSSSRARSPCSQPLAIPPLVQCGAGALVPAEPVSLWCSLDGATQSAHPPQLLSLATQQLKQGLTPTVEATVPPAPGSGRPWALPVAGDVDGYICFEQLCPALGL